MNKPCPFCSKEGILFHNELGHVRYDRYPVNPGHMLVIPNRHVPDFFDTTQEEKSALLSLLDEARRLLMDSHAPDGFNVGINIGEPAGQTVMHVHIHLIPRYRGDMENPRGGVRGVIPSKQSYSIQEQ